MYRRPKFLEILLEIRRDMALEADYDVELFAETARSGNRSAKPKSRRTSIIDSSDKNGKVPEISKASDL
jgi:hypothetical protein